MLQEYQQLKISEYQNLYDRLIPMKATSFRKFNNLMDFSFVRDELEHKYCLNNWAQRHLTRHALQSISSSQGIPHHVRR